MLAVTAGTPTAVRPSVAPLGVATCLPSINATPPSNRIAGVISPNTLSSAPRLRCLPLSCWEDWGNPGTVIMLGCSISNRLSVVVKRPVSIFTPVSACVVLLGGNTVPTLEKLPETTTGV